MRDILKAIRSGHWPSLLAAWLHFEVSFMAWLLVGALGVLIAEEFGLTATQKGLLVAVPLLGGAILRIPVGLLPPFAYAAPLTVAAVSAMGFGNGVVFQVAAGRFPK